METNEELLNKAAGGDREAEATVIENYRRLVMLIVRKFLGNQKNTCNLSEQDFFQEGMLALYRAVKTYKVGAGAKFDTYASRCIRNRLIDIVRRETSNDETDELLESQTVASFSLEDEIDAIEKNNTIKTVLGTLPKIERAVFNSYRHGYSYNEISKIFDLSPKKIDNLIQKIKTRIKEEL